MIWYLLLCSGYNATMTCQPPKAMPSERACMFLAAQYRLMREYPISITVRCAGARK